MKLALPTLTLALAGILLAACTQSPSPSSTSAPTTPKPDALNFVVKNIDGKDVDLSLYSGKVLLILNVASKCGNTPQYAVLEKLYTQYKDQGLVVLGFPANNFNGQEPGTNAQIKEFCEATYKVDFPMFAKVSVKGDDIAPLFKYLTSLDCQPLSKGDVAWNFEKFLVDKKGKLIGRFGNRTQPDDPAILAAIQAALK